MRLFLCVFFSFLLMSCQQVPKVPVFGPHLQMFNEEIPIFEVTYDSSAKCEIMANAELKIFDINARNNIINGRSRIVCSNFSLADKLSHQATIVELITNVKNKARFQSGGACMVMLANMQSKSHMIYCY